MGCSPWGHKELVILKYVSVEFKAKGHHQSSCFTTTATTTTSPPPQFIMKINMFLFLKFGVCAVNLGSENNWKHLGITFLTFC